MISSNLILICGYSIGLAVLIGAIRFRRLNRSFYPFILVMVATLINEILNPVLIRHYSTNAVNTNILNLVVALLWLWQFRKWDSFIRRSKWKYNALVLATLAAWTIEHLLIRRITIFNSFFSLLASFMLVFLAIDQINRLIIEEKKNLFRNSKFLICIGVMVLYAYKIMVESFYVMQLDESNEFLSNIFIILVFVNLFVNLLYALATLWIPTRQRFTMQY